MTDGDIRKKLISKAGALLARRAFSRGELRVRLLAAADEEAVDATLDRLQDLNLLNDANYAYNFALRRTAQDGWGPVKVLQALIRRRVEPGVAQAALERVREETGDEAVLQQYLDRHCRKNGLPKDRKGIARLISHLRRRGYRDETIMAVLRRTIPAAPWQRFDTGD